VNRPNRRDRPQRRRRWLLAAALAVGAEWAWVLGAQEEGFQRYQPIQARSPFSPLPGLEPEEPTTTIAPTTTMRMEWAETLYLTGVSLVMGQPVAFLERLRGAAVEDTYMLAVGDELDGMRVLGIDPGIPSATVQKEGHSVTLTFDKEKPAGARATAANQEREGDRRDSRRRPTPPAPPSGQSAVTPRQVVPPSSGGGLPSLRSRRRTLNR
jgi:hypothetical protein